MASWFIIILTTAFTGTALIVVLDARRPRKTMDLLKR